MSPLWFFFGLFCFVFFDFDPQNKNKNRNYHFLLLLLAYLLAQWEGLPVEAAGDLSDAPAVAHHV